jgi:monoamine oxidase
VAVFCFIVTRIASTKAIYTSYITSTMPPSIRPLDIGPSTSSYFAPVTITSSIGCIQVSGQVGTASGGIVPADYESQIHLALLNLHKVITAAGASIQDIAKLNLYIVDYDPAHRSHVRHLQRFLGQHRPAITLVPIVQLAAPNWLFEVDAVVAKPGPSFPISLPDPLRKYDVIIIGAGLAGLTAAEAVVRSGHSCLVLEARDRVGGRTWSAKLPGGGGIVDLGAAWINDTNQSRAYQLALRSGAELIEQNTEGNCLLQDANGDRITFPYGELPVRSLGMLVYTSRSNYTLLNSLTWKHRPI